MKRFSLLSVFIIIIIGTIVLVWPRRTKELSPEGPLVCYVGGTMTPVMNAIAAAYREDTGAEVDITSADSGELLAAIELQLRGDLYIAHDPFMDIAMRRGVGVSAWQLGELHPVMIVRKGNPKRLTGIKDLMRPDVRVYLTDYEHSTLGNMLPVLFRRAGLDFAEFNKVKQVPTHRSGSWVANQLIMKSADAALVWQVVAGLRQKDLDIIPIDDALPRPGIDALTSATGKTYDIAPVKVAIVTLACSKRSSDTEKFIAYATSGKGKRIFTENGFDVSDAYGRQMYRNGIRLAGK